LARRVERNGEKIGFSKFVIFLKPLYTGGQAQYCSGNFCHLSRQPAVFLDSIGTSQPWRPSVVFIPEGASGLAHPFSALQYHVNVVDHFAILVEGGVVFHAMRQVRL